MTDGDSGEVRELTVFFADLVDSTALSTQIEPETYRLVVGRYREQVERIVSGHSGHIGSTKGDGLLVCFGYPSTREDDASRAVQAGLDITRAVSRLSGQSQRRFGFAVSVRVGVHFGLVFLDTAQGAFYGSAAAVATRLSGLAPPGAVVVSDSVATLVRNNFELHIRPPMAVTGVEEPIIQYQVVSELAPVG